MRRFSPWNILYVVWFLVYYLIMSLCFGAQKESFVIVGCIYGVFILIAFTPIAESLMRLLEGAREPRTRKERERISLLFEEVYESTLEVNPSHFKNIQIFIKDSMDINAFAMGKKTLCVTKGTLELLGDDEIKGIIAHEMGHFAHGDTMAMQVMTVGNILFFLFYKILNFAANICYSLLESRGIGYVMKILWWILNKIINFLLFIGDLILMPISRKNEFAADRFAFQCGYGSALISVLEELASISTEGKMKLRDYIKRTHPALTERIGRLESLEDNEGVTV